MPLGKRKNSMACKIFIQCYCRYPHGSALANYVENLAKGLNNAGYYVVLVCDVNSEESTDNLSYINSLYVIEASSDFKTAIKQKENGFSKERIEALIRENISSEDVLILLGLYNAVFLKRLYKLRDEIGFHIIAGVLELFSESDYTNKSQYDKIMMVKDGVFLESDGILSISDFISSFYKKREMKVFQFPPMIDSTLEEACVKNDSQYHFILSLDKDSVCNALDAFADLSDEEKNVVRLHLCNSSIDKVRGMVGDKTFKEIERFTEFHEWMKYEELEKLYRTIHFMLIPRECCQRTLANFPSKVPEGMKYGVVPICSDVGDYTKYYLSDNINSIFIYGDSKNDILTSIRKALAMGCKDYSKMSQNAREFAIQHFDYSVWKKALIEMIEKVTCSS